MGVKRQINVPLFSLAVLLTLLNAPYANAQASFFGLGKLPGAFGSDAYDISADGSTVVGAMLDQSFDYTPARWTMETGWEPLDLLNGDTQGHAIGVSGDGSIAVGNSFSSIGSATRWSKDGGVEDLGILGFGIPDIAAALKTSADGGTIVGLASTAAGHEAFRWTESSGMVGLGHLGDGVLSTAHGVSPDGSVIVGASSDSTASTTFEAFRWTAETGMVGLGQLQSNGFGSEARDISGDGNVIIGRARRSTGSSYEGFRWTADTGMVGIGGFPGGTGRNDMFATNYYGSIMVGHGRDTTGFKGAIWDETNGIRTITSFAEDELGLDLSGWTISTAYGISDDGTRIVGIGGNPSGQSEAWMLVIPEPNTSLLLLAGIAIGSLRRRRRPAK